MLIARTGSLKGMTTTSSNAFGGVPTATGVLLGLSSSPQLLGFAVWLTSA